MAFTPNDPLYAAQLQFASLGLVGGVQGIQIVWDEFRGAGIFAGVYDSGVDSAHVDLNDNLDGPKIIVGGQPHLGLPGAPNASHGTGVAGIIGAEGNNGTGGLGIAFDVSLAAISISLAGSPGNGTFDQLELYDVVNGSFGGGVYGGFFPNPQYRVAAEDGRGGLGTAVFKSAGNSAIITDTEASDAVRWNANVAASLPGGQIAGYSNYGPSVLVTALGTNGNIVTTDISGSAGTNTQAGAAGDYMNNFNGTSAATPIVTGVAALMLDANPFLGWRDVQDILAASATQTGSAMFAGPSGSERYTWAFNNAGNWNGGGNHVSDDYGFGSVNVYSAVRMAEARRFIGQAAESSGNEITETSGTLTDTQALTSPVLQFIVPVSTDIEIDTVSVTLNITDANLLLLRVSLISPEGHEVFLNDGLTGNLNAAGISNYNSAASGAGGLTWTWNAQAFRGELASGNWKIKVVDPDFAAGRALNTAKIDIHGGLTSDHDVYTYTDEFFAMKALAGQSGRGALNDTVGDNWIDASAMTGNIDLVMNPGSNVSTVNGVDFLTFGDFNRLFGAITGDGADVINGNNLGNKIYGMRGGDQLFGNNGGDTIGGGAGADLLNGGDGFDVLDYSGSSVADGLVVVRLGTDFANGGQAAGDTIAAEGGFNSFEGVIGGDSDNDFTGDSRGNLLVGGGGTNQLTGFDGNDTLTGGSGVDAVFGNADDDYATGGDGADGIFGGVGQDTVFGGRGSDSMVGNTGDDLLFGDQDLVSTGAGSIAKSATDRYGSIDTALFVNGTYSLDSNANIASSTTIRHVTVTAASAGGAMDFYAFTVLFPDNNGTNIFDIDGASFNSSLRIYNADGVVLAENDDASIVDAGSSSQLDARLTYSFKATGTFYLAVSQSDGTGDRFGLLGAGSSYQLHLSVADSSANPSGGNDLISGDEGNDTIDGGSGGDDIFGGDGNDSMTGGGGSNQTVNGDAGNDTLTGGGGLDAVNGGEGDDLLFWDGFDAIDGGAGRDTLDLSDRTFATTWNLGTGETDLISSSLINIEIGLLGAGADSVTGDVDDESIDGGAGSDELRGNDGADTILGGDGADTIYGGFPLVGEGGASNADSIDGGTGDDSISGSLGADTMVGGDGNDTIQADLDGFFAETANHVMSGDAGNDFLEGAAGDDSESGGDDDDTLSGGGGNDTLDGGGGNDTVDGGSDNDEIYGNDGNDILSGGGGNDTIYGGFPFAGEGEPNADSIDGGAGDDSISGSLGPDTIAGGEGNDTIQADLEGFLDETASHELSGDAGNDAIQGAAGADKLDGGGDDDTVAGGGGGDTLTGGLGSDSLDGGGGSDTADWSAATGNMKVFLFQDGNVDNGEGAGTGFIAGIGNDSASGIENIFAGSGNDLLIGNAEANLFLGGAGKDTLNGGAGDDTLNGGSGADTADWSAATGALEAHLTAAGNATVTAAGIGTDTAINIENLIGGSGGDTLSGNAKRNVIFGNAGGDTIQSGGGNDHVSAGEGDDYIDGFSGNNALNGGAGNDTIFAGLGTDTCTGGAGDDFIFVGNAGDRVVEFIGAGQGNDHVRTSISYTLAANAAVERLSVIDAAVQPVTLTGNGFAQTIAGNVNANTLNGRGGNDTLDGGAGGDTLAGGLGSDTYIADSDLDSIVEAAGNGTKDTLLVSTGFYALAAADSIEAMATADATGTEDIALTGNGLRQSLTGNAGDNDLQGGGGNDIVNGGAGDDSNLQGDEGNDVVNGGGGRDFVDGGDGNDTLSGGAGNDQFDGLDGNDKIDGGTGIDSVIGGRGNDTITVNHARDTITEFAGAGEGNDLVKASVSYRLQAAAAVERLSTTDAAGTAAINLTGNALAQSIAGNAGANGLAGGGRGDTLGGGAGSDTLSGGGGNDRLLGGLGSDSFLFDRALNAAANVDRIADFNVAADTVRLENAVFSGLATGTLVADAFKIGGAGDAEDRILYNAGTGGLFFDSDGTGAAAAIRFATLNAGLALTNADFFVI